jgi:serine/threonine protein kinase
MYYRKRLVDHLAKSELRAIKVVDQLDPEEQWHIGHPEIETKAETLWTLKFKYGGKSFVHLRGESPSMILLALKGMSNIMNGILVMHQHNFYHRDIKISNMLYDEQGTVRLIDFGIAITELPSTGIDDLFAHIYPVWPFETQLVSGNTGVYTTNIYGAYVDTSYYKSLQSLHSLDPSECRDNAVHLKRLFPDQVALHQEITKGIDVYSLGVTLSHLISDSSITRVLSTSQYNSIKRLSRKMVEPYTNHRISLTEAMKEYQGIWI